MALKIFQKTKQLQICFKTYTLTTLSQKSVSLQRKENRVIGTGIAAYFFRLEIKNDFISIAESTEFRFKNSRLYIYIYIHKN